MSDRVVTIVIGQHPLVREGLVRILPADRYHVIAQLADVADTASTADLATRLALLVTGDQRDATASDIATLRQKHPECRVVVLTKCSELAHVASALRAGAHGYLADTIGCEAFLKSLDLVLLGECVLPSVVSDFIRDTRTGNDMACPAEPLLKAPRSSAASPLSCRESEILQCLAEGASNKVIARRFDIAEATVKVHLKAILRKLGARNRTQAALWSVAHLQANGPDPAKAAAAVPGDKDEA